MRIQLFSCVVFCLCGVLRAADPSQDVADAVGKLREAGNYSWKTVTRDKTGVSPQSVQSGQIDKDGYTALELTVSDTPVRFIIKGSAAVMNFGQGWKTLDDVADQRRIARYMSSTIRDFKSPVVVAQQIATKLKDLKPDEDAYAAEVSGKDADDLLGSLFSLRGNSETRGTRLTARFWVQDGQLTRYELRATGVISRNGNDAVFDRTISVEFTDVGNTTVDVPDDVKSKLEPPTEKDTGE